MKLKLRVINYYQLAIIISFILNIILFVLLIQNLWNKNNEEQEFHQEVSMNNYKCLGKGEENELKQKVINKGDKEAYDYLSTCYLDYEPGEFLPYAMIMANRWKSPVAFLDVYYQLIFIYDCSFYLNLEIMDSLSREMALEYLLMGYETAPDDEWKEHIYNDILELTEKGFLIKKGDKYYIAE